MYFGRRRSRTADKDLGEALYFEAASMRGVEQLRRATIAHPARRRLRTQSLAQRQFASTLR